VTLACRSAMSNSGKGERMTAVDAPGPPRRLLRARRFSVALSLTAAVLFLGSAVLQLHASLQRWVAFRGSLADGDVSAEDHLYDYTFALDPWVHIGTTAQLFGAGTLILAVGVVVMALGIVTLPHAAVHPGIAVIEVTIAVMVAGSFGVYGLHAYLSGIAGAPSSLQHMGGLSLVAPAGLIVLAACWWRRSVAARFACVFLFGSSEVGILLAAFVIAPLFAGGVSHDTTPWTETVVAASTAAAGISMLFVAQAAIGRRWRMRAQDATP
jgi:hypothetical protein